MMDFVMSYKVAKAIFEHLGPEGLLKAFQSRFPNLGLYSLSVDWFKNPKYICKAKGTRGDLIVSWFDFAQIEEAYLSQISTLSQAGELSRIARILQPFEFLGWFEKHSPLYDEVISPAGSAS